MFFSKLKAGALQLTLFIVVVIALLLAAFIIFVHTQKRFSAQTDFIIETTKSANKGVDYALLNATTLNDTTAVDLEGEDYKTLKIHRNFWGLFEKITATSKIKSYKFKKVALIGSKQIKQNRTALYLQDNNKPLVLVGNTKIEGVAYLPKQGVKPGTISGNSYYGSQLIYGQTKVSSSFPKLTTEAINHLENINTLITNSSQEQFITLEAGKTYTNSFLKPTQIILSNNEITLRNVIITGNVIIKSKKKITVDASSKLQDVILIAPKIEIKEHVKGAFQAFASKEIVVIKNCELAYPSALVLVEENIIPETTNTIQNTNHIKIDANSTIKGVVVFLGKEKQNNHNVQIEISENAKVIGEVYCTDNVELKGSVFGNLYTNNFIAKQFGSIYQNHIYNGTIIVNELPEEYIGLPFNNSKKDVLKWLY